MRVKTAPLTVSTSSPLRLLEAYGDPVVSVEVRRWRGREAARDGGIFAVRHDGDAEQEELGDPLRGSGPDDVLPVPDDRDCGTERERPELGGLPEVLDVGVRLRESASDGVE